MTLTGGNTTGTTFSGVLADGAGTLALVKTGTGTLVLAGANTYTGATTVSGGIVRVQTATALGSAATGTTVASGAAIEIDGAGLTIAEPVTSLIGTGVGGTGALRNLAGANTWSGAITIGAGNATVSSDAGTLTTGAVGGATRTLTVTGSGNTTVGGVIATTSGSLVKTGSGTLVLAGANTYTGATTVGARDRPGPDRHRPGHDRHGHDRRLGCRDRDRRRGAHDREPVTSLVGTGVGGTGALRNLAGANTWSGAITIGAGNATVSSDAGTLTTGAVGGATRTLTVTGSGNTTVGGVIATTSGSLVKTGTGTLVLARANTYTGTTTVGARHALDRRRRRPGRGPGLGHPGAAHDRRRHPGHAPRPSPWPPTGGSRSPAPRP